MITSSIDYVAITNKLISKLSKKIRNYADCQDIAQEILLSAMRTYNPSMGTKFETHCFTVLHGKAIDHMRSKSRKGNLASLDILQDNNNPEDPSFEIPAPRPGVDLMEIASEVCDEQELFILENKIQGYDGYEIANMLGVTPGYISQKLGKIVEKLRGEI